MSRFDMIRHSFPPKATWGPEQIPDLMGKVAIVTGGTSGAGLETAKALLSKNAKVYIAARGAKRAEEALQQLKDATGKEAVFLQLDLADLKNVKSVAEQFLEKEQVLHILVNNGGVMNPPADALTVQGYDLQFGTNMLGPFYLTKLLYPALNAAQGEARVVFVASAAWTQFPRLELEAATDTPARRKVTGLNGYGHSKFAMMVVASALSQQYGGTIVVSACHPGTFQSDLGRYTLTYRLLQMMLPPASKGALTQLYAATAPEAASCNGKWFVPWARVEDMPKQASDPDLGKTLLDWCEKQVENI